MRLSAAQRGSARLSAAQCCSIPDETPCCLPRLQDYLQSDAAGAAPVDGSDEALLALADEDGEVPMPAGQIEPEQRAYLVAEKAAALVDQYVDLSKEELLQVGSGPGSLPGHPGSASQT